MLVLRDKIVRISSPDIIAKVTLSILLQVLIVQILTNLEINEEETIHLMDITLDFSQDSHHSFDLLITIILKILHRINYKIRYNHFRSNPRSNSSSLVIL